jgi:hypothetical protein
MPLPLFCRLKSFLLRLISTPVASELILLTVRTRQCRVPTPINCRDTALPCPLYHSDATGNNIKHHSPQKLSPPHSIEKVRVTPTSRAGNTNNNYSSSLALESQFLIVLSNRNLNDQLCPLTGMRNTLQLSAVFFYHNLVAD